ncbi:MAG: endo alpha-1,4 polygalactosaminidase [Leptospirales bacterium]
MTAGRVLGLLLILFFCGCRQTQGTGPSTPSFHPASYAIYYGHLPIYRNLDRYDWVIVSGDFPPERTSRSRYFAYLTIGEIDKGGEIAKRLERALGRKGFRKILLESNPHWNSWIADIRSPVFRDILLNQVSTDERKGFRGVFLDTLDSPIEYEEGHPSRGKGLRSALVSFILELHRLHPGIPIIVNRGFPILPRITNSIAGILFEDFCSMYDDDHHRYVTVPENLRKKELLPIRAARAENPELVALALDYGSPRDPVLRRHCANMAKRNRLIPFFSNRNLDEIP